MSLFDCVVVLMVIGLWVSAVMLWCSDNMGLIVSSVAVLSRMNVGVGWLMMMLISVVSTILLRLFVS